MKYQKYAAALVMIVLLVIACGGEKKAESPASPYFTDMETVQTAAARNGMPILIDFYTDWCTWCKRLDTVVLRDKKATDFFSTKVNLVHVNAEKDTLLAQKHHVSGYPTLVLLGTDGQEIDRIIGYMEVDEFLKTITDYQNGIGTLADLLNKAQTTPTRELTLQIAEKYKYRGGLDDAKVWYQKVIATGDPTDSLSGESRMSLTDMLRRDKQYDAAIESFKGVMEDFAGKSFAQDAELWIAIVCRQKGDTTSAIKGFEQFIEHYPKSEDAEYAKTQIDKLKGIEPKS
jgi:thioredoxin-related protein